MRERGVWHSHIQAGSISELEMWLHYREMVTPGDLALLVREGLLVDLGAGHVFTPRGVKEQAKVEDARKTSKQKRGASA